MIKNVEPLSRKRGRDFYLQYLDTFNTCQLEYSSFEVLTVDGESSNWLIVLKEILKASFNPVISILNCFVFTKHQGGFGYFLELPSTNTPIVTTTILSTTVITEQSKETTKTTIDQSSTIDEKSSSETTSPVSPTSIHSTVSTKDPDDEGKNVCDENNPCQNGGTCEQEDGKDYKCYCMEGFNGTNCEIIQWCQDNNEICGNAPCEYDEEVGSAFCSCKDDLYFDAKSKTCVELDKCLLARIKGNCNGDNETCDNKGNCRCEENYAYNDNRTACEPDFCWKISSKPRCGKNMECSEGDKSFSCFCKKDFWQIGANCVKVDKCTPGVSKCEHQCANGYCFCFPGFKLNDDGYSCDPTKSDTECELDCGIGTCVKEGTIEKCICPQISHVFRRGTCIDKCKAKELKEEECPKEMGCLSDEEFGYKCNCTGKYDFADDDVHCKAKPMCSEGGGNEVCSLKGGLCEDNFALSEGYKCRCNFGYKENPKTHVCEHMCETAECHKKQALCTINAYNAVECICPPLLVEDTNGICNQLAKYSYTGDFSVPKRKYQVVTDTDSVRIKRDTSQDINYAKLLKDFEDSEVFRTLQCHVILNCLCAPYTPACLSHWQRITLDEEDDWKCFLEIKLNEDPQGKINIVSTPSVCLPFLYESYCLIPPDFTTRRRKADDRQVFHKTNPCDERVIGKLCGYDTECKVSEPSGFKCVCKAGYFRRNSFVLAQDVLIDFCEDIDECLNPTICPNASTCFNLPGDYTCKCKDGYRLEEGKSVKRDGCRAFPLLSHYHFQSVRTTGDYNFFLGYYTSSG
ncbi:hypothetical protein AVEN_89598-1 [Araneus ventricosus]|uniref:EGF-like domain-containing protein n=1 Tax=Araneus ventricosus TaxID=182803 RepID=A0A4Y2JWK4_ARAVE|nr:hypothetical protein AVEN_89598-1 [Araneus ventricosus]